MSAKNFWYLENLNLFKILCPHKYDGYKGDHVYLTFGKGDFIYFEEDIAHKLYLIERGRVKIGYYLENGDEVIKTILSRGEVFGEKALFGEERRTEFAQSIDNKTTICPVSIDTLYNLMRDHKDLALHIYKFMGLRILKLERHLELLLFKDAKTRVIEFIYKLAEENGEKKENGDIFIKHHYTQKEMASLLGMSRPTLNTTLNELKQNNHIDLSRNKIILHKNFISVR